MFKQIPTFIYISLYILVLSLSITVFYLFRPYPYVDNCSSFIDCTNKNVKYYLGPSFVYTFDEKLDSYNSKKACKLCEYGIMWDYDNVYKVSDKINYRLNLIYQQESSWPNALFISLVSFIVGTIIIETTSNLFFKKNYFGSDILKFLRYLIE